MEFLVSVDSDDRDIHWINTTDILLKISKMFNQQLFKIIFIVCLLSWISHIALLTNAGKNQVKW